MLFSQLIFNTLIMNKSPDNGDRRFCDDVEYIFYYGYWIRYYAPLEDSMANRKRLIDSLTRRAFHHTEAGINTPGQSLEQARAAYQNQTNPARRRVNAAMLAGSLFNRATDLFTSIVDLAELGVKVSDNNELMGECSDCFEEALTLGKQVKHHSGCEGIDEIWGEPFKAFTMSPAEFYQSRFIKIAQSMRDIDRVGDCMIETFCSSNIFADTRDTIMAYVAVAKRVSETMKKDPVIFHIWPEFVALAEALDNGRIAGAGLDVLAVEPPDDQNLLLKARNCYVTPHIAWATRAARERLLNASVENVAAFLAGEPQNVVN